ncbi:hypothetical protein K492DRAFT_130786 [Lichtheimia hyalospora FSU 10163]|nr:hypothetical protein K492DRAFT_130786 [Lichtheimia hyalospora FSU 10163]
MILEVDKEFASSNRGELLRQVIVSKEAEIKEVDTMYYTIAWSRKCTAEWNEEQASFIPYSDKQVRIIQESQVLIFMPVSELCELVQSSDRDGRIDRMQAAAGNDKQLLLMVEGLEAYYKRKNLLKQRDFEQAVIRSMGNGNTTAEASSSNNNNNNNRRIRDPLTAAALTGPTKQDMEEALTYFQLMKNIMLVPTTDEEDTVDWIVALTADIGSAPYK